MGQARPRSAWPQEGYVPPHVPAALVRPYDLVAEPGMDRCPFAVTSSLHDGPRIFWNPTNFKFGGAWVLTRAEDIRTVFSDPQTFSSAGQASIAALFGEDWDLIPIELDPPDHARFRKVLQPLLTPAVVAQMTPDIRAHCIALLDGFAVAGGCEFMAAFGRPFPIGVFMDLVGIPRSDMALLVRLEHDLMHGAAPAVRMAAATAVRDYLQDFAAKRRARPCGDMASAIVLANVDGEPITNQQALAILYVLFIGGLDTVAATAGFIFRHLALNPDLQAQLRQNPEQINKAVDEFLRRFSVTTSHRRCRRNVELGGVAIKAGDWITLNTSLGSLDPLEHRNPLRVDVGRPNSRHFAFTTGPHFCLGSHLAKRELAIMLEEWLDRIPTWTIQAGTEPAVHGWQFGVDRLELSWPVS